MSSESADIGVLRSAGDPGINAAANDESTTRMDVYAALEDVAHRGFMGGSCCAADKADGSTTAPSLPNLPGLHIKGIGNIPLPISDSHAEAIKSNLANWKVDDAQYQVEPEQITILNPKWGASLKSLVKTVALKLGANPDFLSAELSNLLYMGEGSSVGLQCTNDKVGEHILGTLLVQLPSSFTGGKMSIISGDEEDKAFDLGAGGEAEFACHFVCYYSDCDYSFEKIKVCLFDWVLFFHDILFDIG